MFLSCVGNEKISIVFWCSDLWPYLEYPEGIILAETEFPLNETCLVPKPCQVVYTLSSHISPGR